MKGPHEKENEKGSGQQLKVVRSGFLLTIDMHDWPLPAPPSWLQQANEAQNESELAALRQSVTRGEPHGDDPWQKRTAKELSLESALRPPGRPRKLLPDT